MAYYKFVADTIIEADSEEEAVEMFCNNSYDFASTAECYPVCDQHLKEDCKECEI